MRSRLWVGWTAGATLAVFAYFFVLPTKDAQTVAYDLLGTATIAAMLVGIKINAPVRRLPWYLMTAGMALWVGGDMIWSSDALLLHRDAPFPGVADILYLASYPALLAGLMLVIRGRTPGGDRAALLDALTVTGGAGLLSWAFLIEPNLVQGSASLAESVVSAAYPLVDVVMLGVLVRLLFVPEGYRWAALRLLGLALLSTLIADVGFSVISFTSYVETGSWVDTGWLFFYVFSGAALLHPSMRRLPEPAQPTSTEGALRHARFALVSAASLLAPAVLWIQSARGHVQYLPVIATTSVVMFLLVLARMAGLLRGVESAASDLRSKGEQLEAALAELRESERARTQLLDGTVRATEAERARIASDLHDGPIQRLSEVTFSIERLRRQVGRGETVEAAPLIERIAEGVSGEISGLRRVMTELRPAALSEHGLESAVRDHVDALRKKTNVACALEITINHPLDPDLESVIYRVIQEGLTNVSKHAHARMVSVRVATRGNGVELRVDDDGVGFAIEDQAQLLRDGHFGLAGMRQRVETAGGRWQVRSAPGSGTTLSAWIPYGSKESEADESDEVAS